MAYRQALEEHGLSLEQGTPTVPNDGCYYVLRKGEVVGRFKSLRAAQAFYAEQKKGLNLQPVKPPPVSIDELRHHEAATMSNKRLLWTEEDFTRVDRKTRGKRGTRSAG
jgi:hypothetical protein